MDIERIADFWIAQVTGIGPVGRQVLVGIFISIKKLYLSSSDEVYTRVYKWHAEGKSDYRIPEKVLKQLADPVKRKEIITEYESLPRKRIIFVRKNDPDYPERLRHIQVPPEQLFYIGRIPSKERVAVGIVGARECTPYGRDMARLFGYKLAKAGVIVVSGMAKGVDGWAHRGALEAGGETVAVLGCGVEICYPRSNERIYREIPEKGCIISEYPTKYDALPANFPLRNRIISGLSNGILVVEARIRSGSLITADAALDQGRDVFVIPGRIGDELSVGCNRLIRQGAIPVVSPDDILEYYNIGASTGKDTQMTEDERKLYSLIKDRPISLMELASKSQGAYGYTVKIVRKLERDGYIREICRDKYIRSLITS